MTQFVTGGKTLPRGKGFAIHILKQTAFELAG
jgi:hypothetical protein